MRCETASKMAGADSYSLISADSDDDRHRLNDRQGGRLLVLLKQDHDPQWLYTATAPSEIGSVIGQHRHG